MAGLLCSLILCDFLLSSHKQEYENGYKGQNIGFAWRDWPWGV